MADNKILAIVGCDADAQLVDSLSKLGFSVQILPRHISLPSPVSSHADMLMFVIDGCVFAEKQYVEDAKDTFDVIASYGYRIIPCDISLGNEYPNDIGFNIALCNNVLYGNIKYNASEVIDFANNKGVKITPVKQGYTKCSTVVLGNDAIITADDGIAQAATKNGLKVLKTNNSPDSVVLDGYNYGFIGGACGVFENNIYFSGNIDLHPEGRAIKDFCESLGFSVISLSDSTLVDIGGIIFLPYYS